MAVLITNHVMSDPSGGAMFVSDPKKPVGGHVMAHASTIRLSLRKGKGEQRLMKVVDAPNLGKFFEKLCLSLAWLRRNNLASTFGQALTSVVSSCMESNISYGS